MSAQPLGKGFDTPRNRIIGTTVTKVAAVFGEDAFPTVKVLAQSHEQVHVKNNPPT